MKGAGEELNFGTPFAIFSSLSNTFLLTDPQRSTKIDGATPREKQERDLPAWKKNEGKKKRKNILKKQKVEIKTSAQSRNFFFFFF